MGRRLLLAAVFCLSMSGCGLIPIPYSVKAAGPVRGVRVIDAADGSDVACANVTFHTGVGATNWMKWGFSTPVTPPDEKAELADIRSRLPRKQDGSYEMPDRKGMGLIRPFGLPSPLGCALYNPPVTILAVLAQGYHPAGVLYYPESSLENGWRAISYDSAAITAHCNDSPSRPRGDGSGRHGYWLDGDGILTFYLQRIPPTDMPSLSEQAQSRRVAGRVTQE
ncbi:MAG: hypothetical protein LLG00_02390 [Planctomycetaceae bacterium]|nr:hypothetical protein [Planctomycetaceae bacterium]